MRDSTRDTATRRQSFACHRGVRSTGFHHADTFGGAYGQASYCRKAALVSGHNAGDAAGQRKRVDEGGVEAVRRRQHDVPVLAIVTIYLGLRDRRR